MDVLYEVYKDANDFKPMWKQVTNKELFIKFCLYKCSMEIEIPRILYELTNEMYSFQERLNANDAEAVQDYLCTNKNVEIDINEFYTCSLTIFNLLVSYEIFNVDLLEFSKLNIEKIIYLGDYLNDEKMNQALIYVMENNILNYNMLNCYIFSGMKIKNFVLKFAQNHADKRYIQMMQPRIIDK